MTTDEAATQLNQAIDAHRKNGLPLGLHFDLDFPRYLNDTGLGSGDIKTLAKNPYRYWWFSHMNPIRPEEDIDSPSRLFGRALHKCVLEGRGWFENHFSCGPDQRGMTAGQRGASTRAANEAAAKLGKECLKKAEYEQILFASSIITNHPDLRTAFVYGRPEVSFFWMQDGVRMKMRLDYLKCTKQGQRFVAGIADLKSVGEDWRTEDFVQACYNAIARYEYHVQASHYLAGAGHIRDAIAEGCVYHHGGKSRIASDKELVERLTQATTIAWCWVFFSKADEPDVHPIVLSPGNEFLREGRDIVERGIANFKEWMAKKGPSEMWKEPTRIHEAEFERLPGRYRQ
jgi:hypothetical protein